MAKSFSDFDPTKTFITQTNTIDNKEDKEIIQTNISQALPKIYDKTDYKKNKLKIDIPIKEKKTKQVNLLMKPSTYKMIQEIANANNISINEAIHISIEELYNKSNY